MFRNSRSTPSTALDTATSAVTITTTATAATYSAAPMSCTTHWHRCKKLEAETAASTSSAATSMTTTDTPKPRKVYSCQTCRQAMNKQTGHTQFKRKRCCPMSLVKCHRKSGFESRRRRQQPGCTGTVIYEETRTHTHTLLVISLCAHTMECAEVFGPASAVANLTDTIWSAVDLRPTSLVCTHTTEFAVGLQTHFSHSVEFAHMSCISCI